MSEEQESLEYEWWKDFPAHVLLRMRYDNGVRLRSLHPVCTYPSYVYRSLRTINRILDERN